MIPPQADVLIGRQGRARRELDEDSGGPANDFTNRNATFLTWNLLHLARLLKDAAASPPTGTSGRRGTPAAASTSRIPTTADDAALQLGRLCNCYKVRLLLAQLGLAYETVDVSVIDRSNRAELLGDLNLGLRVPTLVLDDGRPLAESNAILWYFGTEPQYVPTDPYERAQVLQWMFFEQYSHEPYIAVARFWLVYWGRRRGSSGSASGLDGGYAALDALERHLAEREFLAAGRYSIADVSLYAYTHVAHEGDFDLEPYPAIRAWLGRVESQPGHVTIDA